MKSIDISEQFEPITSGSGQAAVTRPSWNPNFGYAREQEINDARKKAFEEHQKKVDATYQLEERLQRMEGAIGHLQDQLVSMKELIGEK